MFVASFVRLFTISKDIQRWLYAPTAETITRVELCEGEFDLLSCINQVLEEANLNNILNNIDTRFKKYPGNTYHLYKKESRKYLSLLSPYENTNNKDEYLGSFKLKQDFTWEPIFI